ncbi:DNA-binding winged helix-turn-helix (wHTH) domain-containing protein [Granulicella rosea]|uniref:DNA-binding winged helix-turn-helix (WHTH) domain-containing protein n=1 Tax=Granulicella rosea TaxID=474952 RepID=A0A239MMW7_9BACT|nr:winged helix-turn-helix domain-containing protein [Granulicella rosea]SNT44197.1 DNA-binding winged helix-turn-helix (wHTH) domain-containing protein [Granulicella rosea]
MPVFREDRPVAPASQRGQVYGFGPFRLDGGNRLLTREQEPLALPARAFDTLLALVQRPGQLVTKTELLNIVWADSFVEESNLTVAISTLRRVLGEDPQDRKYIQTVSGRGYRFISPVAQIAITEPDRLPAPAPESRVVDLSPVDLSPVEASEARSAAGALSGPPSGSPVEQVAPVRAAAPQQDARPHRSRTAWALAACLLVAGLLGGTAWRVHKARAASFHIASLVVLPMSGSGVNDEELMGMTDAMIGQLGNMVPVRPLSSVLKYTAASNDVQAAGREQQADAVITARVTQNAAGSALEVELRRTGDGQLLWSHSYRDASDRIARIQSAADRDLTAELRKLVVDPPASVPPAPRALVDPAAYQLYLRGRYFWNRRTEDGLRHSIECFRQSIQADPNYAPAYAGLADSYALLASFSVESGKTANPDARAAALSAIHLDPTLAEPHASLGMIYFFTDWNGPAAEQEFERAIALNPNYATAHHWYALDLAAMGRFPQALYEVHRAQALDPLSLIIGTNVGWIEYLDRRNGEAIAEYRKVLELDPSFVRARTRLGIAEIRGGDMAAAIKDLQIAEKESGDPYVSGLLGEALARGGHTAAAEKILAELQARSASKYVPPFALALVYLGLDRRAEAIKALERSVEDRSTSMVYAKIDPSLDELRKDPEFAKIVAKMRF